MYKAIFFDLDGTLLPMDYDAFIKAYFGELCKVLAPFGISPDKAVNAVWGGTKSMIMNDGAKSNKDRFWESFVECVGGNSDENISAVDPFYSASFHNVRAVTTENPLAREAVEAARKNGRRVILATNPIFPSVAQESRLSWIGLCRADFDLVTDYATDSFCKPNPKYYLSICERMGVRPEECLMVGNDESDDMMGASAAGLDCYLVTDCLIPSDKFKWTGERGTFEQLVQKLRYL